MVCYSRIVVAFHDGEHDDRDMLTVPKSISVAKDALTDPGRRISQDRVYASGIEVDPRHSSSLGRYGSL